MKKQIAIATLLATNLIMSVAVAEENIKPNDSQNYPVVNQEDWRSFKFDDIPWSVPVIMKDDFDGDKLAVMDRNKTGGMFFFGKESGIVSMWAENQIRVYQYFREQKDMITDEWIVKEASTLSIKIGEEVFRLDGKNGNFKVEDDLAQALANAPEGKSKIKITFEDDGGDVVNDIGEGTVKAWKIVYGDEEVAAE